MDLAHCPDHAQTQFTEFWDLSQSANNHILDHESWRPLRDQINRCLSEFFHTYLSAVEGVELTITQSWINRYLQGQAQPRHFHSNSVFSGVVMLCDHPSSIEFYSPHRSNHRWDVHTLNLWNSHSWRMPCERGLLIITPSVLDHQTQINQSEQVRWSLAFDTEITGDTQWVRQISETVQGLARFGQR
jgi:uncharacterized protein (TIGR02466 family)